MSAPHSPERPRRSASVSTPARSPGPSNDDVPSIFSGRRSDQEASPAKSRHDSWSGAPTIRQRPRSTSVNDNSPLQTLGPISPDAEDRVFPMRSFVSVDPTPTPSVPRERKDGYFPPSALGRATSMSRTNSAGGPTPVVEESDSEISQDPRSARQENYGAGEADRYHMREGGQGYAITSDAASVKSAGTGSVSGRPLSAGRPGSVTSTRTGKDLDDAGGLFTARFKHVVTEGGHAVITGRDGETLQRCEDEPIHIPGAVQSFGLLIALQEETEGRLTVRVASENAKRVIGYTPRQLFALQSFTDILSEEQADNLLDHVDFIRDEGTDVETNGPEVFTLYASEILQS